MAEDPKEDDDKRIVQNNTAGDAHDIREPDKEDADKKRFAQVDERLNYLESVARETVARLYVLETRLGLAHRDPWVRREAPPKPAQPEPIAPPPDKPIASPPAASQQPGPTPQPPTHVQPSKPEVPAAPPPQSQPLTPEQRAARFQ